MTDQRAISYTGAYTTWSREAILEKVQKKVKPTRYQHILRVEEYALRLADMYQVDPEACSLAAILHDYAKDIKREKIESIVKQGALAPKLLDYGSQIWHGPAGAYYAKKKFGIDNQAILNAIEEHTIGGEDMSLLSKILFIADYVEEGRDFPGVKEARMLAQTNLDEACFYKISQTLIHLITTRKIIYPRTLEIYNAWMKKSGGKAIE